MEILLDSELFQFHSERMCEIIAGDAQKVLNFSFEPNLQSKSDYGPSHSLHLVRDLLLPWSSSSRIFSILQTLATFTATRDGSCPRGNRSRC